MERGVGERYRGGPGRWIRGWGERYRGGPGR